MEPPQEKSEPEQDAVLEFRVQRRGQAPHFDKVAVESPLTVHFGGRPWITLMRTPGYETALIAGLLRSEAIVEQSSELCAVELCENLEDPEHEGQVYRIRLGEAAALRMAQRRRSTRSVSSCGLCGKEQIEACLQNFPPRALSPARVHSSWVAARTRSLRAAQAQFDQSGAVHAAALFEAGIEQAIVVREDIGRHNAVDKVLGHCFWVQPRSSEELWLVVSGRVSFEIVQKAAMHGCGGIIAVSAPSSLAIELADSAGITLVGFARGEDFVVYSHPARIEGIA